MAKQKEILDLILTVKANQEELIKLRSEMKKVSGDIGGVGDSLKKAFSFSLRGTALFGGLLALRRVFSEITDLGKRGIQFTATVEQSQVAFETLLGDADAAEQRINELVDFAAKTPFRLAGIIEANRQLQVLTDGTLAGAGGLRLVGDAAAATGREMSTVAFWVGRVFAGLKTGTPVGEATLRLIEMGLASGDTALELQRLAQTSRTADEAYSIIEQTFNRTEGAMERQSRTMRGLITTLNDTLDVMLGKATSPAFETVKRVIEFILESLDALPTKTDQAVSKIKEISDDALRLLVESENTGDAKADLIARQKEVDAIRADLASDIANARRATRPEEVLSPERERKRVPRTEDLVNADVFLNISSKEQFEEAQASLEAYSAETKSLELAIQSLGNAEFGKKAIEEASEEASKLRAELALARGEGPEPFNVPLGENFFISGKQATSAALLARPEKELEKLLEIEIKRVSLINAAVNFAERENRKRREQGEITAQQERDLNAASTISKRLQTNAEKITSEYEQSQLNLAMAKATTDEQIGLLEEQRNAISLQATEQFRLLKMRQIQAETEVGLAKTALETENNTKNRVNLQAKEAALSQVGIDLQHLEYEFSTKQLKIDAQIAKLKLKSAEERKKITDETFRAEANILKAEIDQIRSEKELVALDGVRVTERSRMAELVLQEKAAIGELVKLKQEELATEDDILKKQAIGLEIQNLKQQQQRASGGTPRLTRFEDSAAELAESKDPEGTFQSRSEAILASVVEAEAQMGTVFTQINEALTDIQSTMGDSLTNEIAGLITMTKDWDDSLRGVANAFGQSIAQAIAKMAANWILHQARMLLFGKGIKAAELTGASILAAKLTAINATPAYLATVASFGGAAAAAPATLTSFAAVSQAAMATIAGATAGVSGFREGGIVRGGEQIVRINEDGEEFVVRNKAVRTFGTDFFDGINQGRITPSSITNNTFNSTNNTGSSGSSRPLNVAVFDNRAKAEDFLNSSEGETILVDAISRVRDQLIPS